MDIERCQKHDPYSREELEKLPELVADLLMRNGVPLPFVNGKPCRACKICGAFYWEGSEE